MSYSTRTPSYPTNLQDYAPWVAIHGLVAPYGQCQCGCGQDAPIAPKTYGSLGIRQGQPIRYCRHHHCRRPATDRFWEKVDKRGPDDCWLWTASCDKKGYGAFTLPDGHIGIAHRFSYELHYGPIPEGEGYHGTCVLHECDNPPCCNPKHLFLGTAKDNAIDMWEKGRAYFQRRAVSLP